MVKKIAQPTTYGNVQISASKVIYQNIIIKKTWYYTSIMNLFNRSQEATLQKTYLKTNFLKFLKNLQKKIRDGVQELLIKELHTKNLPRFFSENLLFWTLFASFFWFRFRHFLTFDRWLKIRPKIIKMSWVNNKKNYDKLVRWYIDISFDCVIWRHCFLWNNNEISKTYRKQ